MTTLPTLAQFQDDMAQCVRCGACQAHCPVYLATGDEGAVARGKIVLAAALLSGLTTVDDRFKEELGLCLLCGSCVSKCPNRVPTDGIVAALRRQVTEAEGLTGLGKGVAALTGSKPLLTTLLKGADLLAPLLFAKIPKTSGLRLRFGPQALKGRSLPEIPDRSLFARVPEWLPGAAEQPVVGIFAGCTLSYLFPRIGELLARLPHRLGCSVFLPHDQGCCGMPACSSGNGPLIERLGAANHQAFSSRPLDAVLTGCASCHGMLAGHVTRSATTTLPLAPTDIHLFLHRRGLVERLAALPKAAQRLRVAYHDPCHLRTAGITREPRQLLAALPQVEYVEMADAGLCCGLGGTFAAAHPDLSRTIGDRKAAGLRASGAQIVATACPGCLLQLQDIIDRARLPIKAVHTLELLWQAVEPLS